MKTVALITTIAPERCGIRTYAEELVRNVQDLYPGQYQFSLIGREFTAVSVLNRTQGADIVHILHVNSLYPQLTAEVFKQMRNRGQKTVCTFNDSTSNNRSVFTEAFDQTVVHQPTSDGFKLIYHGIPTKELKPYDGSMCEFIGTSGFPIGFKNYPLAAQLARAVQMKLYAILPSSQHADVAPVIREIQAKCPGSIIDTTFPSHDEAIDKLSQCAFLLYPYAHTGTGIGGSARMGMATGRPIVISNVVRFADILPEAAFREEFYVIPDAYPTFSSAIGTVQQCQLDVLTLKPRIPKKTIEAMSWTRSAHEYVSVYRSLLV